MTNWNTQANQILLAALEIDDPNARQAFVQDACQGDNALVAAVDGLLRAHHEAGNFLRSQDPTEPATELRDEIGHFAPGTTIAGKYVVRETIGEGGMGVVLLADQLSPVKRQVAIKLIKTGLDVRSVLVRFDQERNALAMMDHPNIAKVFDAGVIRLIDGQEMVKDEKNQLLGGAPYFAMEYIPGISITEFCDRHQLGLRDRLALFIPVCKAVQHAHQKGIVHRDLKPSNVLVEKIDDQHVVKVIDFGVAKVTGAKLTEDTLHTAVGSLVGTLDYMSPEQASFSGDIDTRTDVYALGVVLYELMVGTVPHRRRDLEQAGLNEILRIIREESPRSPSAQLSGSDALPSIAADRGTIPHSLLRTIRGDLDWIALKALEKERNRRYDSVAGLAADIQRYLDEEPVGARPPSARYRLHKAYRRHRFAFWAAGAAVGLLLLGVIGTGIGFIKASRSARQANTEARRAADAEQQVRVALEDAQAQRDETQRQKDVASSISDFLLYDLISQINVTYQATTNSQVKEAFGVERSLKRDPTLMELLDRAADTLQPGRIDQRFPDQPVVQGMLLRQVGYAYYSIGQFNKALPMLERAFQLLDAHAGPMSAETMAALKFLTATLRSSNRPKDALHYAQLRVDRTGEKYGQRHERTVLALVVMAQTQANSGDVNQAIQTALMADKVCREGIELMPGRKPDEIKAIVMSALGNHYVADGDFEHALAAKQEATKIFQRDLGDDDPRTVRARVDLAGVHLRLMHLDTAEELYEELIPQLAALHQPDHPATLSGMESLASCHHRLGHPEKAIPIYERTLERRVRTQGVDSQDALRTQSNLGVNLLEAGRPAEAIERLRYVHDHILNFPGLYWTIEPLNRAMMKIGREEEAERMVRERLGALRGEYPDLAVELSMPLMTLALNLLEQQRLEDAEAPLRELLALNEKHERFGWTAYNVKTLLGGVLVTQDKLEEAGPLLREGFEGMWQRRDRIPGVVRYHLRDAANRLIEWHEANGEGEQAQQIRDRIKSET